MYASPRWSDKMGIKSLSFFGNGTTFPMEKCFQAIFYLLLGVSLHPVQLVSHSLCMTWFLHEDLLVQVDWASLWTAVWMCTMFLMRMTSTRPKKRLTLPQLLNAPLLHYDAGFKIMNYSSLQCTNDSAWKNLSNWSIDYLIAQAINHGSFTGEIITNRHNVSRLSTGRIRLHRL